MVTPAGDFGVVSRMKGTKNLDHDWTAVVEDLALGILTVSEGLVGPILSALGVSGPVLSTAVLDRCHPAS